MKSIEKILIIFMVLFCFVTNAQKQIEVSYAAKYSLKFKELKTTNAQVLENHFILLLNKETSFFKNVNIFLRDSLLATGEIKYTGNTSKDLAIEMKYNTDLYYTVFRKGSNINFANKFGSTHLRYFEEVKFDWKLTSEQKTINGFKCTKATTTKWGRNWIAYFSTIHLIPSGPYKFYGLPGLIFEIFDDANDYHFTLIKFKNRKKCLVDMHNFPKAKEVTKVKYEQIRHEKAIQVVDFKVVGMPDIQKKVLKIKIENEKNYNPIELTE